MKTFLEIVAALAAAMIPADCGDFAAAVAAMLAAANME